MEHKNHNHSEMMREQKHQEHDRATIDKKRMHNHKKGRSEKHKGHNEHEGYDIADFKKRFWISLIITIPILFLSHMLRELFGLGEALQFKGDIYILFALSSFVFFYGGFPFFKGIINELKYGKPGMMTLIALAITVAYVYSSAVVFGLEGDIFFWELATLIDIMLLGHWVEMRSIMGASRALEELAKLMPEEAHLLKNNGETVDIPLAELKHRDKILIKPARKFLRMVKS